MRLSAADYEMVHGRPPPRALVTTPAPRVPIDLPALPTLSRRAGGPNMLQTALQAFASMRAPAPAPEPETAVPDALPPPGPIFRREALAPSTAAGPLSDAELPGAVAAVLPPPPAGPAPGLPRAPASELRVAVAFGAYVVQEGDAVTLARTKPELRAAVLRWLDQL